MTPSPVVGPDRHGGRVVESRFVSHVMPTPWLTLHQDLLYDAI
ncbi:hypothetical protein ACFIOY_26490 [Bradyrhizobium sp. TZ2]